jgi:dGTP triphosphohydrolase
MDANQQSQAFLDDLALCPQTRCLKSFIYQLIIDIDIRSHDIHQGVSKAIIHTKRLIQEYMPSLATHMAAAPLRKSDWLLKRKKFRSFGNIFGISAI